MIVYVVYNNNIPSSIDKIFISEENAYEYAEKYKRLIEQYEIEDSNKDTDYIRFIRAAVEWNDIHERYDFSFIYDYDLNDNDYLLFWKDGYGYCRISYYIRIISNIFDIDALENKYKPILLEMRNTAEEAIAQGHYVLEIQKILTDKYIRRNDSNGL